MVLKVVRSLGRRLLILKIYRKCSIVKLGIESALVLKNHSSKLKILNIWPISPMTEYSRIRPVLSILIIQTFSSLSRIQWRLKSPLHGPKLMNQRRMFGTKGWGFLSKVSYTDSSSSIDAHSTAICSYNRSVTGWWQWLKW